MNNIQMSLHILCSLVPRNEVIICYGIPQLRNIVNISVIGTITLLLWIDFYGGK